MSLDGTQPPLHAPARAPEPPPASPATATCYGAVPRPGGLTRLNDLLNLEVHDFEVPVLTGIYSEETHLPQPLRISMTVDLECPDHFAPDTPLGASKNYLDLKRAASDSLPPGQHFTLIEGVADHIATTLLREDARVRSVTVKIVKLAIAEHGESIGITLVRHRR